MLSVLLQLPCIEVVAVLAVDLRVAVTLGVASDGQLEGARRLVVASPGLHVVGALEAGALA